MDESKCLAIDLLNSTLSPEPDAWQVCLHADAPDEPGCCDLDRQPCSGRIHDCHCTWPQGRRRYITFGTTLD